MLPAHCEIALRGLNREVAEQNRISSSRVDAHSVVGRVPTQLRVFDYRPVVGVSSNIGSVLNQTAAMPRLNSAPSRLKPHESHIDDECFVILRSAIRENQNSLRHYLKNVAKQRTAGHRPGVASCAEMIRHNK